jgi:hypothetical protein
VTNDILKRSHRTALATAESGVPIYVNRRGEACTTRPAARLVVGPVNILIEGIVISGSPPLEAAKWVAENLFFGLRTPFPLLAKV